MTTITPGEPSGASRRSWAKIADKLRANAGTWFLVAENVSTGTPTRLHRIYGIETRMEGVDPDTHRAAKLFGRWPAPDGDTANRTAADARVRTKHLLAMLEAHVERHPEELDFALNEMQTRIQS